MSPLLLRRYRADRLLREQFEQQRERVIESASARLRHAGVVLDRDDLDAAYAQAWQGLHAAVLDGQQIVNPVGWLAVVTHRRAIDEHRARRLADPEALVAERARDECDFAAQLDDRAKLRNLLEAMRARLSERERQAAALCYLHGLTRAEAAAQMGVSDSRMRKLMEGTGRQLRGVAAKVGALVQAISAGEWCEQQGSLMRGFAFGVLDPDGERYLLAVKHSEACPACRAYVLSLRGLAAVLPPTPALLHWAFAAGAGGTGAGAAAGANAAAGGGSSLGGAGAAGAPAASGLGAGALSASGVAGAGAAGGGWWLAGGLGAKLAVGCLLALGVGAGCVVLDGQSPNAQTPKRGHRHERRRPSGASASTAARHAFTRTQQSLADAASGAVADAIPAPLSSAAQLTREFSPERARVQLSPQAASAARTARRARAATRSSAGEVAATAPERVAASGASRAPSRPAEPASAASAAQREFAPG